MWKWFYLSQDFISLCVYCIICSIYFLFFRFVHWYWHNFWYVINDLHLFCWFLLHFQTKILNCDNKYLYKGYNPISGVYVRCGNTHCYLLYQISREKPFVTLSPTLRTFYFFIFGHYFTQNFNKVWHIWWKSFHTFDVETTNICQFML